MRIILSVIWFHFYLTPGFNGFRLRTNYQNIKKERDIIMAEGEIRTYVVCLPVLCSSVLGKTMIVEVEETKTGKSAIWESGGKISETIGEAILVCGKNGEKLKPLMMDTKSKMICDGQALFPLNDGYHIIVLRRSKHRVVGNIYKTVRTDKNKAVLEAVNFFRSYDISDLGVIRDWSLPLDEKMVPAMKAAFDKLFIYGSRRSQYAAL